MNWDPTSNCQVSQEDPTVVIRGSSSSVGGGSRNDYRYWGEGIQVRRSLGQSLEVCLCLGSCGLLNNWFKVGLATVATELGFASQSASSGGIDSISIVNKPGALTIFSGISSTISQVTDPAEGPQANQNALLQIVSFDREMNYGPAQNRVTLEKYLGLDVSTPSSIQTYLDAACASQLYSSALLSGPNSVSAAKSFVATVPDGSVQQYLSFRGANNDQSMTVLEAGLLGICYCGEISSSTTCVSQAWTFVGKMLIKGPTGGKVWSLPVGLVVSLQIEGWGLSGTDTIRISPAGSDCVDSANLQSLMNFKLGCPSQTGDNCVQATSSSSISGYVQSSANTGV
jgi:hypothetical protein